MIEKNLPKYYGYLVYFEKRFICKGIKHIRWCQPLYITFEDNSSSGIWKIYESVTTSLNHLVTVRSCDCFTSIRHPAAIVHQKINGHVTIDRSNNVITSHQQTLSIQKNLNRLRVILRSCYTSMKERLPYNFAISAFDGYRMLIFVHCPTRYAEYFLSFNWISF